ncbi:MAG: PIN domain-containing protein [Terriglobales bacterium]
MDHPLTWKNPDPAGYVLDSSAVLAALLHEPGAEVVRSLWRGAVLPTIILFECVTQLLRRGLSSGTLADLTEQMRIPVIEWTEELVWQGRDLCPLAWTHGLSLADRACLTTARALGRIALTADRSWQDAVRCLTPAVRVELIRKPR